jgi:endo-1,4-beta-xylanase
MKLFNQQWILPALALACFGMSCSSSEQTATAEDNNPKPLKEVFEDHFLVGAALNYPQSTGKDERSAELVKKHFNTISPENLLKWGPVHPQPDEYNFGPADSYVEFGEQHDMFIVGHALVWHQQTPDWVFEDENGNAASREQLLQRMEEHISTVAGRYKGRIDGWDVVNEALEEDGSLRQSKWLEIVGEDFLQKAFAFARQADPEAELYYNDYNLWKESKRIGAVRLVRQLQEQGIQVDGIGMQGHYGITYPSVEEIEASILAYAELGVKVMVTELDIDILPNPSGRQGADIAMRFEEEEGYNPYPDGLPDSVQQQLADRYAEIFEVFDRHRDKISRVTFWGVADHHSWLNNWPMPGRTSYPMLFDRNFEPKPAYEAVVETASE